MDPGRETYKNEMVQQSSRRMANIPHFQGVVVDRSDCKKAHCQNQSRPSTSSRAVFPLLIYIDQLATMCQTHDSTTLSTTMV